MLWLEVPRDLLQITDGFPVTEQVVELANPQSGSEPWHNSSGRLSKTCNNSPSYT